MDGSSRTSSSPDTNDGLALSATTKLVLHPLRSRPDSHEEASIVVGRADTGQFVLMPAIAGHLIELLDQGIRVGAAHREIHARYGVDVDVVQFCLDLAELGFVASIDEREVGPEGRRASLAWIKLRHVGGSYTPR